MTWYLEPEQRLQCRAADGRTRRPLSNVRQLVRQILHGITSAHNNSRCDIFSCFQYIIQALCDGKLQNVWQVTIAAILYWVTPA